MAARGAFDTYKIKNITKISRLRLRSVSGSAKPSLRSGTRTKGATIKASQIGPHTGWLGYLPLALAVFLLAAMLGIAFERNLVGTLTQQGWGRTLQGVGAALTQLKCGISGFVIDARIQTSLRSAGFTDHPQLLTLLGETYPENLRNEKLLQAALDQAQRVDCAVQRSAPAGTGHYYPHLLGFSGEDSGMSPYTLLAFSLFGINISALTYAYFAIVLLSSIVFAIAHRRSTGAMVGLALLTVGLYLTVCSVAFNFNMPGEFGSMPGIDIKDPRFLGTMAAVPLLHIIVTWLQPAHRMTSTDYAMLVLQTAILAFALHVRFPTGWTILIPLALWTVSVMTAIISGRRDLAVRLGDWRSPRSAFGLAAIYGVLCAATLVVAYSCHPLYAAEGDLPRHTFWEGMLDSLEYNPAWSVKYGALANDETGDAMPMQAARIAIAKLPAEEQRQHLQPDGFPTRVALEKFSQAIFMDILWRDPAFVLETFFVIKPLVMLRAQEIMYRELFAGLSSWHILVLITALVMLAWLALRDRQCLRLLRVLAFAAVTCALLACLPNWLVFANDLVMFDNFVWELFVICVAAVLLSAGVARFAVRIYQFSRVFLAMPEDEGALPARLEASE